MYSHTPSALLAFFVFFPIAVLLFLRNRPALAGASIAIGGTLFLPEVTAFDPPALPPLGKRELCYVAILIGALLYARPAMARARPGSGLEVLSVVFIFAGFATAYTNSNPLDNGALRQPGLGTSDGIFFSAFMIFNVVLPYFLGRVLFRSASDLQILLKFILVGALIYSVIGLIELRMSPQVHRWIYGFHADSFATAHRGGGFRPRGLMRNGLAFAMLIATGVIAAATLARARARIVHWIPNDTAFVYLLVISFLSKSMAALVYAITVGTLVRLCGIVWLKRGAYFLCVLIVFYPATRIAGVFPSEEIVEVFQSVNRDRALSLKYRFDREDMLAHKILERPLYGWGSFQRNRIFDERGKDLTIIDGYWVNLLSRQGVLVWAAFFAMLLLPAARALWSLPGIRRSGDRFLLAGLSLIILVYAIDLLPNGFFSTLPFFFAGALTGATKGMLQAGRVSEANRRGAKRPSRAAASRPSPGLWEEPTPSRPSVRRAAGNGDRRR